MKTYIMNFRHLVKQGLLILAAGVVVAIIIGSTRLLLTPNNPPDLAILLDSFFTGIMSGLVVAIAFKEPKVNKKKAPKKTVPLTKTKENLNVDEMVFTVLTFIFAKLPIKLIYYSILAVGLALGYSLFFVEDNQTALTMLFSIFQLVPIITATFSILTFTYAQALKKKSKKIIVIGERFFHSTILFILAVILFVIVRTIQIFARSEIITNLPQGIEEIVYSILVIITLIVFIAGFYYMQDAVRNFMWAVVKIERILHKEFCKIKKNPKGFVAEITKDY